MNRTNFQCRICETTGLFDSYEAREMMFGSQERFNYFKCNSCACLQIVDLPQDLSRHYPSDYYSQQPRVEPRESAGLKGVLSRWICHNAVISPDSMLTKGLRALLPTPYDLQEFSAYLTGARLKNPFERILDVGCGSSPHRLAAFRRCGFTAVEGIDPFIAADTHYHGVPIRKLTIEQLDGSFALIMFHHSLEHVTDPVGSLRAAANLLRRGGTCLIRIPIVDTYFWKTYGVDWAELDAPRHLYLMSIQTIEVLAKKTGFRLRQTTFDSEGWEIAASKLYQEGIPMFTRTEQGLRSELARFSSSEMREFNTLADDLNRSRQGGRACFYLEKV